MAMDSTPVQAGLIRFYGDAAASLNAAPFPDMDRLRGWLACTTSLVSGMHAPLREDYR